jgi:hyperosmotically inducible periplasmic protein
MKTTRIPLAIALSSALALAVGCSADRTDRTADNQPVVTPTDDATAATTPADPMTPSGDAYGDAMADASTDGNLDGRRSDQPVDDTWITTKVKSSLLADSDVSGLDIEVETVNGVVTLSGEVEQQAQIDRAARIARDIEGVTDVQTASLTTGPANR